VILVVDTVVVDAVIVGAVVTRAARVMLGDAKIFAGVATNDMLAGRELNVIVGDAGVAVSLFAAGFTAAVSIAAARAVPCVRTISSRKRSLTTRVALNSRLNDDTSSPWI
jgi:hypothetical protein